MDFVRGGRIGLILAMHWMAACAADGTTHADCVAGQRCSPVLVGNTAGAAMTSAGTSAAATAGSSVGGMMLPVGAGGVPGTPSTGGMMASGSAGMLLGTGGRAMLPTAGMSPGSAGRASGIAGMSGLGGMAGAVGSAGAAGGTPGADEFEAARVDCVNYINMYRATRMLAPLVRGSAAQEACSDKGAKKDGDSQVGHSSASDCYSLRLYAQNSCPGYPVGPGGVIKTLEMCLDQMWAEGEPPQGSEACKMDLQNCYEKYGHWINMTDPAYKSVVCSFYKMPNGNYWMNQNFGS